MDLASSSTAKSWMTIHSIWCQLYSHDRPWSSIVFDRREVPNFHKYCYRIQNNRLQTNKGRRDRESRTNHDPPTLIDHWNLVWPGTRLKAPPHGLFIQVLAFVSVYHVAAMTSCIKYFAWAGIASPCRHMELEWCNCIPQSNMELKHHQGPRQKYMHTALPIRTSLWHQLLYSALTSTARG